jgi:hypothetical protein
VERHVRALSRVAEAAGADEGIAGATARAEASVRIDVGLDLLVRLHGESVGKKHGGEAEHDKRIVLGEVADGHVN